MIKMLRVINLTINHLHAAHQIQVDIAAGDPESYRGPL